LGIAVRVLVQYANAESPAERGAAVDAAQLLWDNFLTGDVLLFLGAVAWGVAALAAAVAYHRVGAPLAVSLLLGLSAIVLMHGPPIGPIGLVCFATAIVLLARSQRKSRGLRRWRRAQSAAPDLASCLDANAECGGIHCLRFDLVERQCRRRGLSRASAHEVIDDAVAVSRANPQR
jgi:hypothetical protein